MVGAVEYLTCEQWWELTGTKVILNPQLCDTSQSIGSSMLFYCDMLNQFFVMETFYSF